LIILLVAASIVRSGIYPLLLYHQAMIRGCGMGIISSTAGKCSLITSESR